MKPPRFSNQTECEDWIRRAEKQLQLCLEDMESKKLSIIENRIEELKYFLEKNCPDYRKSLKDADESLGIDGL